MLVVFVFVCLGIYELWQLVKKQIDFFFLFFLCKGRATYDAPAYASSTLVDAEPQHLSYYAAVHSPHTYPYPSSVYISRSSCVTSPHAPQHW
jgi:hypothetical protein